MGIDFTEIDPRSRSIGFSWRSLVTTIFFCGVTQSSKIDCHPHAATLVLEGTVFTRQGSARDAHSPENAPDERTLARRSQDHGMRL
jgi:hypothetical protein